MKILIADKFSEKHIARLTRLGCEVAYKPSVKAEELPKIIGDNKVIIVRSKKVTADTIKASDQLALILRAGAGVNTIDVKAASARGVFVTNCPGKNSVAVAELVFALLLSIDRRIPDNVAALRAHKWNKKNSPTSPPSPKPPSPMPCNTTISSPRLSKSCAISACKDPMSS